MQQTVEKPDEEPLALELAYMILAGNSFKDMHIGS